MFSYCTGTILALLYSGCCGDVHFPVLNLFYKKLTNSLLFVAYFQVPYMTFRDFSSKKAYKVVAINSVVHPLYGEGHEMVVKNEVNQIYRTRMPGKCIALLSEEGVDEAGHCKSKLSLCGVQTSGTVV